MKVLIVDDDLNTVEVIRDSINWKQLNINHVFTAYSVSGAQEIINEQKPDIILCDIEMPRGSGIDLLKWIRDNDIPMEFIFLTCHESFDFAATAIEYAAIGYVTKPFNIDKTVAVLSKAIDKIAGERYLQEYSQYGEFWVGNKRHVTESFWSNLLLSKTLSGKDAVEAEIVKRGLLFSAGQRYRIVLIQAVKTQLSDDFKDCYPYAIRNMSLELIMNDINSENSVSYETESGYCLLLMIPEAVDLGTLRSECLQLIEAAKHHLRCTVNCYISDGHELHKLPTVQSTLDTLSQNTLVINGQVFIGQEDTSNGSRVPYSLDFQQYAEWFKQEEQLNIVNHLKGEVEALIRSDSLTKATIDYIHQDFTQVVYSALIKNDIQAHLLFEDKALTRLSKQASHSVFDLMKWVNYLTGSAIEIISQTKKSKNVVGKAKDYIAENYPNDISRNDIAASVYLTPDYLAKLFKAETGEHINDYINQLRVQKAKELLLANTGDSISDIAASVGFGSLSYFSTVFKKATNQSPNEYRKRNKK